MVPSMGYLGPLGRDAGKDRTDGAEWCNHVTKDDSSNYPGLSVFRWDATVAERAVTTDDMLTTGLFFEMHPASSRQFYPGELPAVKIDPWLGPMLGVVTGLGVLFAGLTTTDSYML